MSRAGSPGARSCAGYRRPGCPGEVFFSVEKVGVCGPAPLRRGVWGERGGRDAAGEYEDDRMDPCWGNEGSARGAVVGLGSPPALRGVRSDLGVGGRRGG